MHTNCNCALVKNSLFFFVFLIGTTLSCSITPNEQKVIRQIHEVDLELFSGESDVKVTKKTQEESEVKSDYQKLRTTVSKTPNLQEYVQDYLLYFKGLETKENVSASKYLEKAHALSEDPKLRSAIKRELNRLKKDNRQPLKSNNETRPLFKVQAPTKIFTSDDVLLKKTVRLACKMKSYDKAKKWPSTLPAVAESYYLAKISKCYGSRASESIALFKKAYNLAIQRRSYNPYALYSAKNLVLLLRVTGNRKEAANFYNKALTLWKKPNITPSAIGLSPDSFNLEKINDFLWSARYNALNHSYQSAKNNIRFAQNLIDKALSAKPNKTILQELYNYKAEGFHILAFRIAVEEKNFFNALLIMQKSLKETTVNDDWKKRFMWYAGLYAYQSNQFQTAEKHWLELKETYEDERYQVQTRYWLSRLYDKWNQKQKSIALHSELLQLYPNSFYSLVSQKQPLIPILKNSELSSLGAQTAKLLSNDDLRPLHIRALLLVKAKIKKWDLAAIKSMYRASLKKHRIADHLDLYLYVSRLYDRSGNHAHAISLTTKAANSDQRFWHKYPEHIAIYFPRPFKKIYTASASKTNVDRAMLYAISRQESSFNPTIKSHAGAIGLMQLMPHTARGLARKHKINLGKTSVALQEPSVNIDLGSKLLAKIKRDMMNFLPAVFASYNAGEATVQNWKSRRHDKDPMMWVELIPFGETQSYTKLVWRNYLVYQSFEKTGESFDN